MKIECSLIKENEDGSALIELELDNEAKSFLITQGFMALVLKGKETEEQE